ncbi:unnamed protein product [Pedinophyceae sp. YPF-701]|nr:unnamed protein product [Pedinophyceae sp. YPF-701]
MAVAWQLPRCCLLRLPALRQRAGVPVLVAAPRGRFGGTERACDASRQITTRLFAQAAGSAQAARKRVRKKVADSKLDLDGVAQELKDLLASMPPPARVQVRKAEYLTSNTDWTKCPEPDRPEFAVIGRSNVGKSSLINMLTGLKSLAHVSKEPGKTKCINHFSINDEWYLVDLPGYGFAKVAKTLREEWTGMIQDYLTQRDNLASVLLLVDASIPPTRADLDAARWLGDAMVPYTIVFTKCDKKKKGVPPHEENMAEFKRVLQQEGDFASLPPSVATSSETGMGKRALLSYLGQLRYFAEEQAAEVAAEEVRDAAGGGEDDNDGWGWSEDEEDEEDEVDEFDSPDNPEKQKGRKAGRGRRGRAV